jgi:hypothetical protein
MVGGLTMTNRQWLIWKMIDMSDDEFADRVCGHKEVWSCNDCAENKIKPMNNGCRKKFQEWLKQEHKEG